MVAYDNAVNTTGHVHCVDCLCNQKGLKSHSITEQLDLRIIFHSICIGGSFQKCEFMLFVYVLHAYMLYYACVISRHLAFRRREIFNLWLLKNTREFL